MLAQKAGEVEVARRRLKANHPDHGFDQEDIVAKDLAAMEEMSLELFACPNAECDLFNRFGAGNLSVVERMGKTKAIRRLYCNHCQHRFSERQGSLMQYTKLPQEIVVRVIKCLTYGCSLEATADICEVDPRSVARLLERGGTRAQAFHQLQLEKLQRPPQVVELDELQARVSQPPAEKKGGAQRAAPRPLASPIRQAAHGFTWRWK
jgi:transposase-like protein